MDTKQLRPGEFDDLPLLKLTLDIPPCDPNVKPEEAPRLSKQCAAILARLQEGPATNRELAAISLKYTSRISDLRAAGYEVSITARDHETGLNTYALVRR